MSHWGGTIAWGNAVRGKQAKFQSESIRADLFLGVAIAGINILIGIGLIIVFYVKGRNLTAAMFARI